MSNKPTSLASQLKREDEAQRLADLREDAEVAGRIAPEGKVWVRLVRPYYDSDGILHQAGVIAAYADAIPESAKVLTVKELSESDLDQNENADDLPTLPVKQTSPLPAPETLKK